MNSPISSIGRFAPMAPVQFARLYLSALLIVMAAEWIGPVTMKVGPGKILLLPIVWAIFLGGCLSVLERRIPRPLRIDDTMQRYAAAILQPALLLFIAKLGVLVGASLPKLAASGWALALQEFGHFFGTVLVALPVALLLGIKREAIGATFSIGREPSLAIISERFGLASPEGHGVLAEYITGTIFGAVFIAVFASFVASLHLFDPVALAMGSGIGSGSMMAAASSAIAAMQTPEVAAEVATFAAASNLITTTIGTYFTLFISLPFAEWVYRLLEPRIGRAPKPIATPAAQAVGVTATAEAEHAAELGTGGRWAAWGIVSVITLIGNWIAFKTQPLAALPASAIMLAIVAIGYALYQLTRKKVPAVCWVSLVAMIVSYPSFPFAGNIKSLTTPLNFLAMITPILAFAGLSVAKDLPAFRRLGWRIIVTSFLASAGSFIGASLIAELLIH
jgi:hypothetical protein